MFQQQPFLVRSALACLIALLSLFVLCSLPIGAAAQPLSAIIPDRLPAITLTHPIDLAPGGGSFVDTLASLPGVRYGSASWGDCNNDGASDVLLTGEVSSTLRIARVYQQQIGGGFTLAAVFTGVINSAAAWGDYDNDGWLDLALTGESAAGLVSQVSHNERNGTTCTFSLTNISLIGVRHGVVSWGDYNADGQLDLLVAGDNGSRPVTRLYRNDHGSFSDSGLVLPGIQNGAAAWGDYDNDGRVDLLLTGSISITNDVPLTKLYHNAGQGVLTEAQTDLPALSDSAAAWGDYDNDGNLDLLLEGKGETVPAIAEVYRNDHGVFTNAAQLTGSLTWTGAAWGDYDMDGYLDALISTDGFATAYRNEITGSFPAGINVGSSSLADGTAAWGHYQNDQGLEVLLTGLSVGGRITKIYKYSPLVMNTPPEPPKYLTATLAGSDVVLHWSLAGTGLSYNLRVGTQPGGMDIIAPMALTTTGYRLLPALGNTYSTLSFTLRNLSLGQPYYWSVQAIDTSFVGSKFATEGTFQIPYRVFLPTLLKDFISYYLSEWETEPNNTYLQANGPLQSGRMYRGRHEDAKDYYSVYLMGDGTLDVNMDSPNGGTQLQLFYQIADVDHRIDYDSTPPYHIGYTGPAGWYYVYVYTNPAYVGSETYTLTVTYP